MSGSGRHLKRPETPLSKAQISPNATVRYIDLIKCINVSCI
jgi:hypothetical protein